MLPFINSDSNHEEMTEEVNIEGHFDH